MADEGVLFEHVQINRCSIKLGLFKRSRDVKNEAILEKKK
jgi:hypothetical protein